MAVLGRLLISSAERIDLPDLLSIDSYAAGDWKYFLKGIVGDDKPFILKGFDIIDPQNAIGTQSCSVRVADSVVFYPGSTSGSFFHGLEEGHPQAEPLVPELRKNATNFVYATFSTFNSSVDTRAFWDPDKDGGAGGEFTQDVNTESVLKVDINVSTGSFPANTIPIAKVVVGPVVITQITDCRDLLYRLGTGGINPDPFADYTFRSLPSASYQRSEPSITMTAGGDNPFQGGDKNIYSLKEWMDLVMTKFKELTGATYWYEDLSTYSLVSGFIDALSTTFKSKGQWQHSSATPGEVTWTEDIQIKITQDTRDIIVRAGTKTLADEQVAYIDLQRNLPLNGSDAAVSWTNGQNYVNTVGGAVGFFGNLTKGDWIKKVDDPSNYFLRVEEFYDSVNLGGSTTTAANARSVRLSGAYLGITEIEKGRYDQGVYENADVVVSDRNASALAATGGNFHWLVTRSDVIQNIATIDTFTVSGTISEADGQTAKIVSAAHGLQDGDRITVTAPAGHAGTYEVEVEDNDTFYIETTDTTTGVFTAFYGLATTTARDNGYGLQLESANHNFETGDTVSIAGTVNFDGSYVVSRRSATQFQFAFGSDEAAETVGTATLARVNVRAEQGLLKIVQGESVDIGDSSSENMKNFLGMKSGAQNHPDYNITPNYNTLDGMANYNSSPTDNVTERLSKLTAMMADKSQDRMARYLPSPNLTTITNTTNGSAQEITFTAAGSTLTIATPGSDGNATVALPSVAPGISLEQNQAAYTVIDRNATSTPAIVVANIVDIPISENTFILALRLTTTAVYLWEGSIVTTGAIPAPGFETTVVQQNQMLKLVEGGAWSWNLATETVSWDASAFVQVPGLANSVNEISAGSAVLAAGEVAYVDINRVGPGGTLTVNVATNASLALATDRFIIARRENDDVIIGAHSSRLTPGDSQTLYGENNKRNLVRVLDNVSTSLPGGPAVVIDGITLANNDKVLFTNLTTESDRGIYAVNGIGSSATWTKLDAFNGSDLPYIGALVQVQEGTSFLHAAHEWDGISWKRQDNADVTLEATGFPNRTDSEISFDDGTRTFTVQPTSDYFDYYSRGVRYRKDAAQNVVIPDVEGLYYIYFEGPTLTQNGTFSTDILNKFAYVATVYWDATNSTGIMVGDERHGLSLDWATHQYLHTVNGAQIDNGFAAGDFDIAGDGTADADTQLSIANGRLFDEDVVIRIENNAAPSAAFEQILSPVAEIPVFYRDGASGFWRKNAATTYPLMDGTGGAAAAEVTDITCVDASGITSGQYFTINTANDETEYAVWYRVDSLGSAPVVVGKTLVMVDILSSDLAAAVATKTATVLDALTGFGASPSGAVVTVTNDDDGVTTDAANVDVPGLGVSVTTQGAEGPLPKYNLFSGGNWTQPNADGNNYIAMWIFATNNISEPVVAILGQRQDPTLGDAQANNTYESISFGDLPSAEMKVLYRLIYQVRSSYSNTPHAALRDIRDLRQAVDTSVGAYSATDHGLLTGLTDQDHPASAIYTNTGNFNNILTAADDDVQKALDSLDNKAVAASTVTQDRNMKMVRGGTWAWDLGTTTLSWSANAFIQITGLPEARNQIDAGNVVLANDGEVAYVDINRDPGTNASLTVNVSSISGLPENVNRLIIARRTGSDVIVGTHSMLLIDGESKALEAGISDQHLSFTGASNNADATPDYATAVAHDLRYITENTSLEEGISRLDDQLDKLFGQLRIRQISTPSTRVLITGADRTLLDNTTISQQSRNLLLDFDGAQIDFETGEVFEDDGATPLGIDFTPATIAANQYRWYSITLVPSTVGVDNKIGAQVLVIPAAADGATADAAPRAPFASGIKLGQVVVQNNGTPTELEDILQANIVQLGSGSGSGDGGGDGNSILETLKNHLVNSPYGLLTPSIGSSEEDDLIDSFGGTANFSIVDTAYSFPAISDSITSVNLLDPEEFLTAGRDIWNARLFAFWITGSIDASAVYEISRDGGAHYYPLTMERVGENTEAFVGTYDWLREEEDTVTSQNLTGGTDEALTGTAGTVEAAAAKFSFTNETRGTLLRTSLKRTGTPSGNFRLAIFSDNAGTPGSMLYTSAWYSVTSDVGTSYADFDVAIDFNKFEAGADYFLVLQTDAAYKASFSAGVTQLEWDRSSSGTNEAFSLDGAVWSAISNATFVYTVQGGEESFSHSIYGTLVAPSGAIELNATTTQAISNFISVSSTAVAKRADLNLTVTGSPLGNVYVSVYSDNAGSPGELLAQSAAVPVSSLVTGVNTFLLPTLVVSDNDPSVNDYHLVLSSDATYKANFSTGVDSISWGTVAGSGADTFDGSVWSPAASFLVFELSGRELDLRARITAGTGDTLLAAFAVAYDEEEDAGLVTAGTKRVKYFEFLSISGNENEFDLGWIPDPDLVSVNWIQSGQQYQYPAFSLQGNKIIFPVNTFYDVYNGDDLTVTLKVMQLEGNSFDNSDDNANLLASNHLGSTDASLDRSSAGRGIFLRRPDGTLREIAIDDDDNIVVYSV